MLCIIDHMAVVNINHQGKIMKSYIGKSVTTGKYHMCMNAHVTECNYSGQSRSAANRPADSEEIMKAADTADHMFCKKCFPRSS